MVATRCHRRTGEFHRGVAKNGAYKEYFRMHKLTLHTRIHNTSLSQKQCIPAPVRPDAAQPVRCEPQYQLQTAE